MPYCPQCGTEIFGGRFCPQCGAQVNVGGAENPYALGTHSQYAELGADPNASPIPGFVGAYAKFWKNFGNIEGRASRREFWYVYIWNFLIMLPFVAAFIYVLVRALSEGGVPLDDADDYFEHFDVSMLAPAHLVVGAGSLLVIGLYTLAQFVPWVCLLVRRIHDFNVSGWLALLCFIPRIGGLVILFFGLIAPTRGSNQYGAQPAKSRD